MGLLLIWQTVGGLAQHEPQAWQAKIDKAERKKQLKKERKALEAEAISGANCRKRPRRSLLDPVLKGFCGPDTPDPGVRGPRFGVDARARVHWLAGAQRPLLHVFSASKASGSRGWSESVTGSGKAL